MNLTKSTRERARKTPGAVNCNARVRSEKSTRRISTRQAIFARDLMSSSRVAQLFLSRKGLLVVQEIRDHGGVLKLNHLSKQPTEKEFPNDSLRSEWQPLDERARPRGKCRFRCSPPRERPLT